MNHIKRNSRLTIDNTEDRNEEKSMEIDTVSDTAQYQLECQIREHFARTVYNHKTHEKCADICMKSRRRMKNWQIAVSAITTTAILADILETGIAFRALAIAFSIILLGMNLYAKEFSLSEIAQKHMLTANELWNMRESYLSLLTDLKVGCLDICEIQKKRDEFQEELSELYRGAPKTNGKIYNKARKSLKQMEEMTFSDEEIDKLLPKNLRLNS